MSTPSQPSSPWSGPDPYQHPEKQAPQQGFPSVSVHYGYGPAPYGGYTQPPYGHYPPPAPTNGLAIAALVCSLAGLLTCGVTSLVGAILGHMARKQIAERGEQGDGLALAGVIVGWILVGIYALIAVFYAIIFGLALSEVSESVDYQEVVFVWL